MVQAEAWKVIRLIGQANAESKTAWAKAMEWYRKFQPLRRWLIEAYPLLSKLCKEPLGNIDKITVVDSGDGKWCISYLLRQQQMC